MLERIVAFGVLAALLSVSGLANAASRRISGPCDGCIASLPDGDDPRPLLVLLHGDGETAASMMAAWGRAAEARRIAVLALQCPVSEQCTSRSWWRWDRPADGWLKAQVEAVEGRRAIDDRRRWVVGWSGGASYIGLRSLEFEGLFSAIVIHGGGIPPGTDQCSASRPGVFFLVSDGNLYHRLALALRDHYARCGNPIVWELLHGMDHERERAALASRRSQILDWLQAQPP